MGCTLLNVIIFRGIKELKDMIWYDKKRNYNVWGCEYCDARALYVKFALFAISLSIWEEQMPKRCSKELIWTNELLLLLIWINGTFINNLVNEVFLI